MFTFSPIPLKRHIPKISGSGCALLRYRSSIWNSKKENYFKGNNIYGKNFENFRIFPKIIDKDLQKKKCKDKDFFQFSYDQEKKF